MRRAYLAISYSNRKQFDNEVTALKIFFKSRNIDIFVFVDNYNFMANQENKMMQTAFKEIDTCDFLIAELTTKSIGVGIELGYAFAKKKSIIYLYKKGSEYSTTASGSADIVIVYDSVLNLINQLSENKF